VDYPNLWAYTRDIYQYDGIGDTVDAQHIQYHYQVACQSAYAHSANKLKLLLLFEAKPHSNQPSWDRCYWS
jgi:putative glutathione S-transferase